jgi:hypothetical protein
MTFSEKESYERKPESDSSVGIETGYELHSRDSIPVRGKRFFHYFAASRPALGAHPTSYTVDIDGKAARV